MIKLTWMELATPQFQQAVNVIWDCPMLDGATSYTAHRIKKGIEKTEKDVRDLRIKICNKWAKKDANGKVVSNEAGYVEFEKPEDQRSLEEEFEKEFQERSLMLQVSKLDFQKLASVRGITPRMWEFLAPVCDNLPEEEPEETPVIAHQASPILPFKS